MKQVVAALGFLLISGESIAAQKAISCSLKTVEEHELFGSKSAPRKTENQSVAIFVLDDEKRSIARYNADSRALQDMCAEPECNLEYGSAEIRWAETQTRPIFKAEEFNLNRNDGSFYMFVGLGTDKEATSFKTTGSCNATAMPELTSPTAKF